VLAQPRAGARRSGVNTSMLLIEPMICGQSTTLATIMSASIGCAATVLATSICMDYALELRLPDRNIGKSWTLRRAASMTGINFIPAREKFRRN